VCPRLPYRAAQVCFAQLKHTVLIAKHLLPIPGNDFTAADRFTDPGRNNCSGLLFISFGIACISGVTGLLLSCYTGEPLFALLIAERRPDQSDGQPGFICFHSAFCQVALRGKILIFIPDCNNQQAQFVVKFIQFLLHFLHTVLNRSRFRAAHTYLHALGDSLVII